MLSAWALLTKPLFKRGVLQEAPFFGPPSLVFRRTPVFMLSAAGFFAVRMEGVYLFEWRWSRIAPGYAGEGSRCDPASRRCGARRLAALGFINLFFSSLGTSAESNLRCRFSKHTRHDWNWLVIDWVLHLYGESADDDESVIDDTNLMTNTFVSAPNCCARELVPVSDYVISFTVKLRVCHAGFWFWFLLLPVGN